MNHWRAPVVSLALFFSALGAWAENAIQSINSTQQGPADVVRIELSEPLAAVPAGFTVQTPPRIAIGTAHRDQAAAIRSALGPRGAGITVDTANRLQGREYDVTIVLHPLSGRLDATAFHLETGRLCVLTSRHRHACIVVARAGIQELLDAHPSTEPVHLNVPVKFPDGWEANQSILTHLQPTKVRAS